ncbi:MAG TPA: HAD family hydrolase [Streptosporangiaceae bacterium]|nr:HAD family hydrolase [Streptosporangiaceae bacterium]
MMSIDAVSFDLWGTLISYGDRAAEAAWRTAEFARVLSAFGQQRHPDEVGHAITEVRQQTLKIQQHDGTQVSPRDQAATIAARLGVTGQDVIDVLLVPHAHAVLRACPALLPHAREALTAVKHAGRVLVLTSNTLATPAAVTRQLLDYLGIEHLFDHFFFSGDLGAAKPRQEVFAAITEATAIPPGRIVHIGNEWRSDIQGALGAGCQAIWFNPARKRAGQGAISIASLAEAELAIAVLGTERSLV